MSKDWAQSSDHIYMGMFVLVRDSQAASAVRILKQKPQMQSVQKGCWQGTRAYRTLAVCQPLSLCYRI